MLLMSVIVCSNCQFVPKAFQKPGVRWLYTLSGGTYRVVLSSIGLFRATRSDHLLVLVRQNPLGTLQPVRRLREVVFCLLPASENQLFYQDQVLFGTGATPTTIDCNETPPKSATAIVRSVIILLFHQYIIYLLYLKKQQKYSVRELTKAF